MGNIKEDPRSLGPSEHEVQYRNGEHGKLSPFDVFRELSSVDRLTNEKIARVMAEIISGQTPKEQSVDVLDIGAGGGRSVRFFVNHLRQKGIVQSVHFRWLDKDPNHVKGLKKAAQELTWPFSAEVVHKKWENDKPPKKYDFIMLNHVIYYFKAKQYDALFKKMLGHLKTRGTLFIVVRTKDEDYAFIKEFYERVKKKPFNEAIFEDAIAVIERLNKGDLDIQRRFRSALISFPFGISNFAVQSLIEFYMRTPWDQIPDSLKEEMTIYLKAPERDGKLRQTDGILIITKLGKDLKNGKPVSKGVIYKRT